MLSVLCFPLPEISNVIQPFFRHYSEHYQSYKNGRWCYEDGCFYKGLQDLYLAGGGGWYLDELIRHVSQRIAPDGTIEGYEPTEYALDNINAGKVLFLLRDETSDPRYEVALHGLRDQLRYHPRTESGSFWHKKAYPRQVWLDGVYMALPFLLRYDLDYGDGAARADVRRQVENVRRSMFDTKLGLYYHAYDESRSMAWANPETGLSKCFWSRAIGWYLMGLVDLCELLPESHPDRIHYAALLAEAARGVALWQRPDAMWMQVIDQPLREGNYAETSASAMFSYAFLKGYRLRLLDALFDGRGQDARSGILKRYLRDNGKGKSLGGICLMAGLGALDGKLGHRDGSFEYYISEPVVENDPKGVGPLMMVQAEIDRRSHTSASTAAS